MESLNKEKQYIIYQAFPDCQSKYMSLKELQETEITIDLTAIALDGSK